MSHPEPYVADAPQGRLREGSAFHHALAVCALAAALTFPAALPAQSLASRVLSSDGPVNVIFPSRAGVCGDGESFIRIPRGNGRDETYAGSSTFRGRDGWSSRPCSRGPERVLVTVLNGEATRLSTFVGPVPASGTRSLSASAADASAWLVELATRGSNRAAADAIRAMRFADATPPWPLMLRIARATDRPRDVRSAALYWLSEGVIEHVGLADFDEHATEDDDMRSHAVFVLTQGKREDSLPELIDLSRSAKYPSVRKAAIFWLGQSGDPRAADVYAELLGIR